MNFKEIPSPCFVLNETALEKNLVRLKDVREKAGIDLIVALKGFSFYSVFPKVKQYLSGATASSLHEARLINEEMKCLAHSYAPVYLDHEFDEFMRYSSHITFNSLNQFHKYKDRVLANDRKISMGIRVNPEYSEVETDMYNPCKPGSRLGVTREALGKTLPEGIEGLHFHTLCENDSFTLERTLKAFEERFGDLLPTVKWVNMGGGHLITREGYNEHHLISLLTDFRKKHNVKVTLEPGSAIGWQTGVLRSTVIDIVDAQGIDVAILDISFSAHMPDTLEMPYKPKILGATDAVAGKPTYRMGGMTCLSGDFMGDYSFESPLQIGDQVIFDDMIHYTMVKTTTFNGVGLPSIGVWTKEEKFELHKSFGYDTFKDRL